MGIEFSPGVEVAQHGDCLRCDLSEVVGIITVPDKESGKDARLICLKIVCNKMSKDDDGNDRCELEFDIRTYDRQGEIVGTAKTDSGNNTT